MNPSPKLDHVKPTSIAGADTFPDEVEGLLALAKDYSLNSEQAKTVMTRVAWSLTERRAVAMRYRVPEHEVRHMAESISPRLEAIAGTSAGH